MFDPKLLDGIDAGGSIAELSRPKMSVMQRGLAWLAYPISVIDGLYGPNTRNAWVEFKADIGNGDGLNISQRSLEILGERAGRINEILERDLSSETRTKDAIGDLCREMMVKNKSQIAYVLATTQWETAHTFKPVKEAFWLSENWRKNNLRYYPYYGRGYVQLTWKRNYENYSNITGEKIADRPDLALREDISLFILVHGFVVGTFTGRKITEFIDDDLVDFRNARRCINGLDKASDIATLAETYLDDM